MPVLVLAIVSALIDQGIKYYVQSQMTLGMSIPVINGVFHITYILNPGAAFSILEHQTILLMAVTVGMLAALVYFYGHIAAGPWLMRLGAGLLAGGAIGNLIDRVKTGYVVDFLDFRIWPVFNSADVAIVTGVSLLMYTMLFFPETLPGGNPGRTEKES
ncbi:signal peptidase II [Anaerospora hongkongensis]|uniref:Lipoprotein signal peptidase n=1 Tax=Anaerospora hongkongensis TaxID=244830 RepID=A0A4R1PZR1_9FIRM|nr:signal peptidase II [Anaerospora hongkongensis]TCL37193.1 signal peptidase II [Anaerospora hongkongensis]